MNNQVEEVKSKIDIVEFINKYVPLKKSGINFSGLCPFHQEKTPSFMVSNERQTYKCFGCNEGGDVIDFFMKIEGLEFKEALKMLADQTGVKLTPLDRDRRFDSAHSHLYGSGEINKSRLYDLNDFLAQTWHQILLKHPSAQKARDYLNSRQLSLETLKTWQIGLAPPANISQKLLNQKNFTTLEIKACGQPMRLAGRITFPIKDLVGKTVGFTGRLIEEVVDSPKYWNTPETEIFHKSKVLFGLDKAKLEIRQQNLAIMVEGQMDVITLHQAGYKQVVASSGTSTTIEQITLLKRFTDNIALAFDQDQAGQNATARVIEIIFSQDIIPNIIFIPEGKDPAEAVLLDPQAWQESLAKKVNYLSWLIDRAIEKYGNKEGDQKKLVVKEILPWLKKIVNPVEQSHWLGVLAERAKVSEKIISEILKQTPQKKSANEQMVKPSVDQQSYSPVMLLLGLFSRFPEVIAKVSIFDLIIKESSLSQIIHKVLSWDQKTNFKQFLKTFSPLEEKQISQAHLIASQIYQNLSSQAAEIEIKLLIKRLQNEQNEEIKVEFAQKIAAAEKAGDRAQTQQLIKKLQSAIINGKHD